MNYVILDEFPNYEIYEDGKIIRTEKQSKTGKTLQRRELYPTKTKNGYRTVRLYNKDGMMKQFYLHRLIWEAFNGEIPEGYEIDHLMDRTVNSLDHLRMVSHKDNCNNPKSIERYKRANALSAGKFNRDKMIAAKGKRNHDRLVRTYKRLVKMHGHCGIWKLMHEGHCGYPRAKMIVNEMGKTTQSNDTQQIRGMNF